MFEDLRRAWREAMANFRAELHGLDPADAGRQVGAMRRDVEAARELLRRLDRDIAAARGEADGELAAHGECVRREALARLAGEDETAAIAAEFAGRHRRRAEVLGRKLDALADERNLRQEELAAMENAFREALRIAADTVSAVDEEVHREGTFRDLEAAAREREAERRLDELKRRMR
jgi:hypothetical protein